MSVSEFHFRSTFQAEKVDQKLLGQLGLQRVLEDLVGATSAGRSGHQCLALEPREAAALLERGGEAVGWHPGGGRCLADAHRELSRSHDTADSQQARARVHRSFAPCAGCIGRARGRGRSSARLCGSQPSAGPRCGSGSGGGFAAARPGLRTSTGNTCNQREAAHLAGARASAAARTTTSDSSQLDCQPLQPTPSSASLQTNLDRRFQMVV